MGNKYFRPARSRLKKAWGARDLGQTTLDATGSATLDLSTVSPGLAPGEYRISALFTPADNTTAATTTSKPLRIRLR